VIIELRRLREAVERLFGGRVDQVAVEDVSGMTKR
jgi:hypothetical protein